jgi:predicted small lipoprotein YifL
MQTVKISLLVLLCLVLLGACGLKGPLYLSEGKSAAAPVSTPETELETEQDAEEKDFEEDKGNSAKKETASG